ncbi:hypothetical protein GCM10023196_071230 [Actinoallomurus vinaceus]|uniref:CopC domain-containing protein n=1 Tax=Actinoallomurus vinaceus TaxID=1080074 RepID=A0ABP8UJU5_9ACTN
MVTRQMLSAAVCAAALTIAACSLAPAMMPRGYAGPVRALDSTPAIGGDSSPPVVPTPSVGSPKPPPEAIAPHVTAIVSPGSGRPGDSIRISFVIDRPGWRVDGCRVGFREGTTTACPTGEGGPIDLRVPANARPGYTSVEWTAYYRPDEQGVVIGEAPHADGSAPFLVLDAASPAGSPPDPGNGQSSPVESPIGLPAGPPRTAPDSSDGPSFPGVPLLIGMVVAAGGAAVLVARRSRARTAVPAPSGPMRPQAGPRIRAVARPDPAIRVTAEEPPDGRTSVVRLETHGGVVAVDVQEVSE